MAVISGGDKLAKALAQIATKARGNLKVGFLPEDKYRNGVPVAAAAFWAEYGHGGTMPAPPRPFFRTMIAKESGTWGPKLAALLAKNGNDGKEALGQLGEDIANALGQSITEFEGVPLSPTTLMLRKIYGNDRDVKLKSITQVWDAQRRVAKGETGATGTEAKPLVWTGFMASAPKFEVEE